MMLAMPVFAADDDSTPYMPYTEPTPAQTPAKKTTAASTKKTSTTTKKKAAATKKTATKTPAKKPAVPKPSFLEQGIALMRQEKYEEAKPYLLRAIQTDKNNPNVWYWYGVYHEKTGKYYQAQYFYSKAVTIDPTFEPLSRIVYQPNDSEKTPLWDPKRPAQLYEIPGASTGGIASTPPDSLGLSSFPTAPNDPEVPKVPVYTPPSPGSSPLDGDNWQAGIYVPPSHEQLGTQDGSSPVYVPPSPNGTASRGTIIETDSETYRQILEPPAPVARQNHTPSYTPPEPGPEVIRLPQQKQTITIPTAKTQTVTPAQTTTPARQSSVPASRVVRQTSTPKKRTSAPAKTSTAKTPVPAPATRAARTVSQDVKPKTQTVQPVQPEPEHEEPSAPPVPRGTEYMPPVGQFTPDPGTIPEAPMPPVNQGSQN